jgi:uncharacterized protein YjbI with pentapeptide repeats
MANDEHLRIIKQGVPVWNAWRNENPSTLPDLGGARLPKVDLAGAMLKGASLSGAMLEGADLTGANLLGSYLFRADLTAANLTGADVSRCSLENAWIRDANLHTARLAHTNLHEADLAGADLTEADLKSANLSIVNLKGAKLTNARLMGARLDSSLMEDADLTGATFGWTVLANLDLSGVKGWGTVIHNGPSTIGLDTFFVSKGKIPENFLRGAGVPEIFLDYASALAKQPLEFYSCFISYCHADKSFAHRFHDSLQGRGIRCWLDEKQLLPGDQIHRAVDEAVRLWDKVLLCCSQTSLSSWWVDKEIQKALIKEEQLWNERGKEVLVIIPLNLDGHLLKPDWQDWKKQHLTARLAADFTGWENDNAKFEAQFERVVKALRADAGAREQPPRPRL